MALGSFPDDIRYEQTMVKFYKKSLALLALSTFPAFKMPGAVANAAGEAQDDRRAVFSVVNDAAAAAEGNAEEKTSLLDNLLHQQVRQTSFKIQ